ncbi:MAG: ARMT1-like domain-containing protein [Desulfobulbaceae bacterium]|nr:ARMT1-like domain-containing protein [Desulfobulbaceae bacterium]
MQTSIECLSCFACQALATARLSSNDPDIEKRVVQEIGRLVSQFDLSLSPPENAVEVYALIAELTDIHDPYEQLRKKSNAMALSIRDRIRRRINSSENPVKTALHYAVAANIIDYGARHDFDEINILENCLHRDFFIDDTEGFISALKSVAGLKILYLADNSGEIVFDGLLVEQLQKFGCDVTLAVRGKRILNDVTIEDAVECGIDKLCRVITNGTGCPGSPLSSCSDTFRKVFSESDIIISKGQGNFETLSEVDGPIYFLLTVKCRVVGRHIAGMRKVDARPGIDNGEMILMKKEQ